jgi:hypothetical protein
MLGESITLNHNSPPQKVIEHFCSMALPHSDIPLKLSPFHAVLHDGIDRLFELLQPENFTFVVKGETLKSTLAEAVLISPTICEGLKSDPTN